MALKFRRGTTAQKSGSLAFGEPYVNTTLGTLQIGLDTGDVTLSALGTGSNISVAGISGSSLNITGNAKVDGNLTLGGQLTIGDATSDTVNVVASLSSSLIPSVTNTFDLGSADKIWRDLYISTGSIKFIEGNSVVKTFNAQSITALEAATGSSNLSITALNTFTASQEAKDLTLASVTASLNTYTSSLNSAIQLTGSTVSFLGNIVVYGTQSIINSENLAVNDNLIYLNEGSTITNPDLGLVGNYNDGTYAHAGIFRDASDGGAWKVFEGYNVEPSGTINTTGNGFTLADFKADVITATSFNGTINATNGVVSGSSQIIGILSSLNTYTGSNDTTNTTQTSRLDQLSTASGSAITRLTALEIETLNLETFTSSINTTIKTQLNINTVVSGSSQITLSSTTGGGTSANVQFGSLGIGMAASGTSGRIDASGDIVAFSTSDRNFKENITPIPNALEKISKISGNTYDWKEELKDVHGFEGNDVGVIAQEIEEVLPQLVTTRETGYKAVKYDKLVALLIEGIKEQQTQIHNLTLEVENLKKQKGL